MAQFAEGFAQVNMGNIMIVLSYAPKAPCEGHE